MAEWFRFTKAAIEALPVPAQGRAWYRDTAEKRLGLYVTSSGRKSYVAMLTVAGKSRQTALGQHPYMSVPLARQKAQENATTVAHGVDPIRQKRENKAAAVTLREVLELYLAERDLKDSTRRDYRNAIRESYEERLDKPLAGITEKYVSRRYKERGKESRARADNASRVLRAIFNYARGKFKNGDGKSLFPDNPANVLSETKTRFEIQRRRTTIKATDFPAWWRAVHELNNPTARDYMVFLALTGTRRHEAAQLRWEHVDFKEGSFHLPDTKNGEPVTLPLPGYAAGLLSPRRQKSGWVFPAPTGKTGYMADPRKSINHVRAASGVQFCLHDLRRGFTSVANGLDISVYSVKALLNHKVSKADVTAGYDVPDLERLRTASAKIEGKFLRLAGVQTGNVVSLHGTE